MASSGPSSVYTEDELSEKWDRCLTDGFLKFSGGFLLGAVCSLMVFKKRKWPMIFGGGFGIGMAYSNCERDINSLLVYKSAKEEEC